MAKALLKPGKNFFSKDPATDTVVMIKNYLDKDRGVFFYFRTMCIRMQERFAQLADHSEMPKVFLHGNPHLENYVKTERGAAMIDFDRSRFGPYAWDIVRLLSSIALRKQKGIKKFLPDIVLDYLYEGYVRSFSHADLDYKSLSHLEAIKPQQWEKSVNDYLKTDNNWAKKLKENPLKTDDPAVVGILTSYLESRSEIDLLDTYLIERAGKAEGTLQNKRILVVLAPKEEKSENDRILLDIKSVYQDADNQWYQNPYEHHGVRMNKAAELYAPYVEERLGYATYNGEQYWGRAIPTFSYKIKSRLDVTLQLDLAYSVGTQLGQAHRKSVKPEEADKLLEHLSKNYADFVAMAEQMSSEIVTAHNIYVQSLQKTKVLPRKLVKK